MYRLIIIRKKDGELIMRILINETKTVTDVSYVNEQKETKDNGSVYSIHINLSSNDNDIEDLEAMFTNVKSLILRNDSDEQEINFDYSDYTKLFSVTRKIRDGIITTTVVMHKTK